MSIFEHNSAWWNSGDGLMEGNPMQYMSRDDVMEENEYGEIMKELNQYVITVDSQCEKRSGDYVQNPYLEMVVRADDIDKLITFAGTNKYAIVCIDGDLIVRKNILAQFLQDVHCKDTKGTMKNNISLTRDKNTEGYDGGYWVDSVRFYSNFRCSSEDMKAQWSYVVNNIEHKHKAKFKDPPIIAFVCGVQGTHTSRKMMEDLVALFKPF